MQIMCNLLIRRGSFAALFVIRTGSEWSCTKEHMTTLLRLGPSLSSPALNYRTVDEAAAPLVS